jgi:hypothetical protein
VIRRSDLSETIAESLARNRLSVRALMVTVAVVAVTLGVLAAGFRWLLFPSISVRLLNDSKTPIHDVRLTFLRGERSVDRIMPGEVAMALIQSGGDAGIFLSYKDSDDKIREGKTWYESGNRGWLDVRVSDHGPRMMDGIYAGLDLGVLSVRVPPTGRMSVRRALRSDRSGGLAP